MMVEEENLLQNNDAEDAEEASTPADFSPNALLQRFGVEEAPPEPQVTEEEKAEEATPEVLPDEEIVEPEAVPDDLRVGPMAPVSPSEAEEEEEEEEEGEAPLSLEEMSTSEELLPDPFAGDELFEEQDQRAWFVIHCYSGSEQKVKHNLEQRIESMGMHDYIFQVVVPTVEEIEIKDGERYNVERCLYPGYILVQMIQTDDSWYVVRNTPGVTGFVGMGNRPVPLRSDQVKGILHRMEAEAPQIRATFKPGQKVRIIEGPFADFIGVVEDIDEERAQLHVLVSFFGRETPVELDFLQVEKT